MIKKLFDELSFESISIIPLAKDVVNQQETNECIKARGMDVAIMTVNISGQKANSTTALGLYYSSRLHDAKGET